MERANYQRAVETGAARTAGVLAAEPDAPVPGCPGWRVADLCGHLGLIYRWAGEQVRRRDPEPFDRSTIPAPPDGPARVEWLAEGAAQVVAALRASTEGDPAGGWRDRRVTAGFWHRRLAHETTIHSFDATAAIGQSFDVDSDLAADGVDEVLDVYLPFVPARVAATTSTSTPSSAGDRSGGAGAGGSSYWPPRAPLHLERTDAALSMSWHVGAGPDGPTVSRAAASDGGHAPGASSATDTSGVTVAAPAFALLLFCWGRRPPRPEEVTGDQSALADWGRCFHW